jgi:hypothetical protein
MARSIALQPVSWQRMAKGVDAVQLRLERAAAALTRHGIEYAVVGGNAIAAWVSRVDESAVRNTREVDILLRREDETRARQALESAGFVLSTVVWRHPAKRGRWTSSSTDQVPNFLTSILRRKGCTFDS